MTRRTGPAREAGAATVLVIAFSGLLVSVAVVVMAGVAVVATHRIAQSAADLAALAGASAVQQGEDPCGAAASIASRNRARLRSCAVTGWDVAVVVSATARLPGHVVDLEARGTAGPASDLDPGPRS